MDHPMRTASRVRAVLCAFLLGGCATQAPPPWELPPQVQTLTVNGYPMAYTARGSGPVIVLVHGAFNDYRYWQPQLDSLSARYRVVSVSLRHYYPERWKGVGDDFSVRQQAEDLGAFIERLGTGPVYLVAHSRGGSVAAGTARLRPDMVKKLVLLEPSLLSLAPRPASAGPDPNIVRARNTVDMLKKGDTEGALEYYIDDLNGPGAWKRRTEADRDRVRDNAWTVVGGVGHADIVGCEELRAMRMPILLMESEKGPQGLRRLLGEAQKCAPSARRVLIPAAGHSMNRDNPAAFDAALSAFLDEAR
jgi:esterase